MDWNNVPASTRRYLHRVRLAQRADTRDICPWCNEFGGHVDEMGEFCPCPVCEGEGRW